VKGEARTSAEAAEVDALDAELMCELRRLAASNAAGRTVRSKQVGDGEQTLGKEEDGIWDAFEGEREFRDVDGVEVVGAGGGGGMMIVGNAAR